MKSSRMELNSLIMFIVSSLVGFISNGATLVYIVQSFDIKIHVFLLLLIDALFATISCFVHFLIDVLLYENLIGKRYQQFVIGPILLKCLPCFFFLFFLSLVIYFFVSHWILIVEFKFHITTFLFCRYYRV